ncbi:hypothetical protein V565_112460 [Rhizoctonia solani 123E]|uniref:F-box domain-containing protein n=1 Tax=Rhizoctonia solani 123E TaxID=1423351 RepID=A0A074RPX4_9AGAM|nr:hypothetical protein V565_112460 [Rhizoctonia solani 123E]
MAHPFEIPEILCLICEQAQRSDLAKLLTLSRLFFECAMPFIWKNLPVSAPMILLRLLPDSDRYLNTNLGTTIVKTLLESLQPLDSQSLTRFNLYAPFVKRIVRHHRNKQSNVAWDRLLNLVDARPILPNLEALSVSLDNRLIQCQGSIPCLKAYLSPTLVEIDDPRTSDAYLYMEPLDLARLLSEIAQECPHLSTLKLQSATGRPYILEMHGSDELARSLGKFRQLRVVRLGLAVLDPKVIVVLSSLPNLESLSLNESSFHGIRPGSDEDVDPLSISLPPGSFPALRHLGIYVHYGFKIAYDIWGITGLVRGLTSASVHALNDCSRTQLRELIRAISQSSPLVTSLHIECTRASEIALLSKEIMDCLALLPLQHLRLSGKDRADRRDYYGGELLALALPKLESLQIRGYSFSFTDLTHMAKYMPRLQTLSIPVRAKIDWPLAHELHMLMLAPSPSPLELQFLSCNCTTCLPTVTGFENPVGAVESVAAGLHELWPKGVTCGTYRNAADGLGINWIKQLDAELKRLRKAHEYGSPQTEVARICSRKRGPPWVKGA